MSVSELTSANESELTSKANRPTTSSNFFLEKKNENN